MLRPTATELASRTVDWHALCGRREPEQFPAALAVDAGRQPDEIAFIQDARRASDPCLNPSVRPLSPMLCPG
jgi:hypothetical protein